MLEFAGKQRLFEPGDTVIVAISGGVDSVVLAHLLYSLNQPMVLAHCNFQLRGEESNRDEQFVRGLAAKWGIPLFVETFDTKAYAKENKLSTQVAARQLRYCFFEQLRNQVIQGRGKTWIATAHHANDAAETMLMNLFRGTGIDGLKGIPVKNGFIIRPLLFAFREQIETYAAQAGLEWVEDSSNEKQDYARNLVRHSVIPAVQQKYPLVVQNLVASMERLKEAAALYHQMVSRLLKRMIVHEAGMQKIPVLRLSKAAEQKSITWEWIKDYGFTEGQAGEVVKLLDATNGSYISSESHRLLKNRGWLILTELNGLVHSPRVIEQLPAEIQFEEGRRIVLEAISGYDPHAALPSSGPHEAWLDAAQLPLPLVLRLWKPGDYFYPLGMAKKKKIARFLIDHKVSPIEKEKVWVLESMGRIVWVVGYRIDDRYKITAKTRLVVKMKVLPGNEQNPPGSKSSG